MQVWRTNWIAAHTGNSQRKVILILLLLVVSCLCICEEESGFLAVAVLRRCMAIIMTRNRKVAAATTPVSYSTHWDF